MSVLETAASTVHPARAGARPVTAEDLWTIPRVGAPAPAPDGAFCVVPVTTYDLEANVGRTRLWRIAKDAPPVPLTAEDLSSAEPAVSPDGKQLAFTRKLDGKAQVHVMPLDGGEARKLTDLPLGAFDPQWLPDGSGLVFAAHLFSGHLTPDAARTEAERRGKDPVKAHVTEERFYRFWDTWLTTGEVPHLFHYDLASGALRDLMPESTLWFDWMEPQGVFDVSPDGKDVAFSAFAWDAKTGVARSAVYVLPLEGGAPRNLTPDRTADASRPRWTPDGRALVYGLQHDPYFYADRVRVMRWERASDEHRALFPDWDRSPGKLEIAPDGTLVMEAEDDGRLSLFTWRGDGEPKLVVRGGWTVGLAIAGGRLHFTMQSLSQPPEVWTCAPDGTGLERLTGFTDDVAGRFALGEVREMRYEGARGAAVQMFVVLPPGAKDGVKLPLVQVIHGGPHATSGDVFHFRWNPHLFAAPGYAVALVNFQGSTSWGQDFAKRIQGEWAARPYEDIMRGTDLLVAAGIADETRLAAAGGSYGGYMAAWIAGHTDRFRCIVNHAGVFDTLGQYGSDWTSGRGQAWGGEAWDGLEALDRCNPARFTAGMTTPMLVIHGERDYRVPANHGLECYGILKAKGVPARLVYFPDENHWVLKPKNSLLWYREVHAWLSRWLESPKS
jgi:dipeptidyl aminopeptidase/acylaminoacyl peptidase